MKGFTCFFLLIAVITLLSIETLSAQNTSGNVVNVQQLRTKMPENGSATQRDSLILIYNQNVVNKNEHILSHREYAHFFTGSNHDYLVIEEYKDLAGMEASFLRTTELEKLAWPDEMKRKAFLDAMNRYFEDWHGDGLYRINAKLSKN